MTFLLDTNVISELRKIPNADKNVTRWADNHDADSLFLSVISIFEIQLGASRLAQKDPRQAAILQQWIDNRILPNFEGRILPVDTYVAVTCAGLHIPNPRAERDAMIAATASVHSLTVATRNVRDFLGTGVSVINPWDRGR